MVFKVMVAWIASVRVIVRLGRRHVARARRTSGGLKMAERYGSSSASTANAARALCRLGYARDRRIADGCDGLCGKMG